jgi:hypothetical protein
VFEEVLILERFEQVAIARLNEDSAAVEEQRGNSSNTAIGAYAALMGIVVNLDVSIGIRHLVCIEEGTRASHIWAPRRATHRQVNVGIHAN